MESEVLLGLPERLERLVVDVVGEMVGFAGARVELVVVMEILRKNPFSQSKRGNRCARTRIKTARDGCISGGSARCRCRDGCLPVMTLL